MEEPKIIDTMNRISPNAWRNSICVVVLSAIATGWGLYVFHGRLYKPLRLAETEQTMLVVNKPITEVKGIKEYRPYIIGGDVAHTVIIPKKRDMFIPFDMRGISAETVLIKDMETGEVLFGNNEYTSRSLASITKLMSALVLEERVSDWNAVVASPADTIFDSHIYAYDSTSLEEWFRVALIGSSNRAMLTLVDGSGYAREEFVNRMNEKAFELGMTDTHFTEPTGIDSGNVSTASDVALLLREALRHEHIVASLGIHSIDHRSSVTEKTTTIRNTNRLLTQWVANEFAESVIGKTGYIVESKYNFAGKFSKSPEREVLVVVLGSENETTRFTDASTLADWAFTNYEWVINN
jgi:D-alanyl-D-alanine carboxypeptidase